MLCAICFDEENTSSMVSLPGCGHSFHVSCALTAAQYDAKCPVCRKVPSGVEPRMPEATIVIVGMEEANDDDDGQREWVRYRNRRRRCMNRNPAILDSFNKLKEVRQQINAACDAAEREYTQRCREVWRTNPIVREHALQIGRLRRRERRLQRFVHDELRDRIGPEPS